MSAMQGRNRKEALKEMIRRLHAGAPPESVKAQFAAVTRDVTPVEIAQIEQELIQEGMPREEVMRLCDVHMAVFKEGIEREQHIAPPGHPVHILMEEHRLMLGMATELSSVAQTQMERALALVGQFKAAESHYIREENVIFPYLEKHGVTQPPAIMWMEHDRIREIKKGLFAAADGRDKARLREAALALAEMLASHFNKENSILFPTALRMFSEDEWKAARRQFDELGYTPFTPDAAKGAPPVQTRIAQPAVAAPAGEVAFETGSMPRETLEALINTLPVDITFVDAKDTVRYFSQAKDRIFPRTTAVLGRSVQNCHPQKSIHVVNKILADFRAGKRESTEFWINLHGKVVYIRYFPVRGKNGEYLGCLEVTQDIAGIQKLKGEKRLLDG
jgi:PAS domain S-box-containing protein